MYELALTEWGLPPEYINKRWTEEEFLIMFRARNARIIRHESQAKEDKPKSVPVSESLFLSEAGVTIKKI